MRVSRTKGVLRVIPTHTLVIIPTVVPIQTIKPIASSVGQHLVLLQVRLIISLRIVVFIKGSVEVVACCDLEYSRNMVFKHYTMKPNLDLFVVEVLAEPTVPYPLH